MNIVIISVGGKLPASLVSIITDYTKRLPKHISVNWRFLKHEPGDTIQSIRKESENILKSIPKDPGQVMLLDETGTQLTSPALSKKLFGEDQNTTFIIGGAYGVSEDVKERADFIWSLSDLVLPHQHVRLLLAEQIYRAHAIDTNHPYHHS